MSFLPILSLIVINHNSHITNVWNGSFKLYMLSLCCINISVKYYTERKQNDVLSDVTNLVLGRELIYFVKHETKCKEWYTGNEVISMLDNIFAEVGRHIFNKSSATSFCAIEMGGLWQYNLCNPACKELFQSCGMLCFSFYYAFWVLLLYVQLKRYGASMSQMTTDMFRLS
jgi:hypothetical protein